MRNLNYDNPGTDEERKLFLESLKREDKEELLRLLEKVAESCDYTGKGYVNQFEQKIRRDIGYTKA